MITLTGVSRFRIGSEVEGFTPYRKFAVSWNGFEADQSKAETDPQFDRPKFFKQLDQYFQALELSTDWPTLHEADDELLINSLSMLLEFDLEDKQALLEAPSLVTRRETLVTLLEYNLRQDKPEDPIQ